MNKLWKISFTVLAIVFLFYLTIPVSKFPVPLWDFQSSIEPADNETSLRRGYYTNITREQLMSHYVKEFKWGFRLNYPPEEAKALIRDQTQSSFLEEIVHPMKESLFINGYQPKSDKEVLEIKGIRYDSKVIIKHVTSALPARLLIGVLTITVSWLLINEWKKALKAFTWTSQ